MAEYLAPGVYVEEVDTGPKPIEGVSTSTSGMVGVTERGPENDPTFVTGYADFVRQFGGMLDDSVFTGGTWYLPHAVKGFFDNGGKRLYVVRVLPGAATYASVQLYGSQDALLPADFSTTLVSRAEQDEALLVVASNTAIDPGDSFLISDQGASEYREVSGSLLGLATPATGFQAAGIDVVGYAFDGTARTLTVAANAGATALTLSTATGLAPTGGDLLQLGTSPTVEYATTQSVTGLVATLAAPVRGTYAIGAAVNRVDIDPNNVIGTTPLVVDAFGDDVIAVIRDPAQLGGSDVVGFGGPPSSEYHPMLDDMALETVATTIWSNHNSGAPIAQPTLTAGTARALTADAAAGAIEIILNNRVGLAGGSILRLQVGTNDEYVIVEDVIPPASGGTNPGTVSLVSPLKRAYTVAGTTVTSMTDAGPDANATVLMRDANPGESILVLGDASAYAAAGLIRIEAAGSSRVEYHQLRAVTAALVPLGARLSTAHATGTVIEARTELMQVQAIDRGIWGNSLRAYAKMAGEHRAETIVPAGQGRGQGDPTLQLQSVVGIEPGSILEFYDATTLVIQFRQKADAVLSGNRVQFVGGLDDDVSAGTRVRTREFALTVEATRTNPFTLKEEVVSGMSETFKYLSMDPRHSRYAPLVAGAFPVVTGEREEGESELFRLQDTLSLAQAEATLRLGPDIIVETLPDTRQRTVPHRMGGGDDAVGSIADSTYVGTDDINPDLRTGLHALKNIEEISIVAIPGRTGNLLQQELITHCELLRYRFAVIDPPPAADMDEIQEHRGLFDTKYAAIYYPWLAISDPFPENPRVPKEVVIPPSGHMMGIYARSDNERGVHKAPANEVIRGITNLEQSLMKEHQDILNPRNINVLRNFRSNNRGLRVWGARVMTSDSDWKYVNVRRLFIFVEHSIDKGTQWVVFEPNSDPLWERVRRVVSSFLLQVWKDGALMGRTPEEAFFVKCDRTTMTQADIDNGKLIVLVGIAPVKPAEFVIFRIGQKAGGSELDEG